MTPDYDLIPQDDEHELRQKKKPTIDAQVLARGLMFGITGTFVFLEIQKYWGTAAMWGALGAIGGLAVPIIWDAFKKMKEEEKSFQAEVDARFDRLEQRLPSFMTHSELDTLRADIGIARADCDRALRVSSLASDTARSNQDRINDIISSGVIFQLTQNVTGLKIKMLLLEKLIKDTPVSLTTKEILRGIE